MNTTTTTTTVVRGRVAVRLVETNTEGGEQRITARIPSRIWPGESEVACWISRWPGEGSWRLVCRSQIIGSLEDQLAHDWVSHCAAMIWELGR